MSKVFVAGSILFCMIGFGLADALLLEQDILTDWRQASQPDPSLNGVQTSGSSASSMQAGGVQKVAEPDVSQITNTLGFTSTSVEEQTLIEQIVPAEIAVTQKMVLLKDGDRAGIVAWVDSAQSKIFFLALKEALHTTFSTQVHDLVDETQQREGRPTRNLLSFRDPEISEERIVFIRIRERLYEFHVADGMDQALFELVEQLTQ